MNRLVLFDIDGTLLSARGVPRLAFGQALHDVFGTAGPIEDHAFDGKTDPQIARELLRLAGLADPDIDRGLPALWERYLEELAKVLDGADRRVHVYPGVRALLQRLDGNGRHALVGLLTGNIRRGAELKLASAGLEAHFRVGAFGCDHELRERLPAVAVARARELTGVQFGPGEVVIIGDTPADMTCGRSMAVRAVGVTTGRFDRAALAAAGADHVFTDLSGTDEVLAAILS